MMLLLLFSLFASSVAALQSKVIVTGAAGRTGKLVFGKLIQDGNFNPVAVVRTESSKKKLMKELKCGDSNVVVADIADFESLKASFTGAERLVLCTSAVPQIKPLSILKIFLKKLVGKQGRPEFKFRKNGSPYHVDWLGAKNQFDAAKACGLKQVVVVGSMGGTQPENFLNTIGKVEGDDLSGDILVWKRKAEKYLIENTGLSFTIIHPGGLIDKSGGEREIVFGVDDALLKEKVRQIPRADVAEVCVQALGQSGALKRSFDIIGRLPEESLKGPTKDWAAFFAQKGDCKY